MRFPPRFKYDCNDGFVLAGNHTVKLSELDANGHVNSAVYFDWILNYIAAEKNAEPKRISINYIAEALLNEEIEIYSRICENIIHVYAKGKNGPCFYAEIEFK